VAIAGYVLVAIGALVAPIAFGGRLAGPWLTLAISTVTVAASAVLWSLLLAENSRVYFQPIRRTTRASLWVVSVAVAAIIMTSNALAPISGAGTAICQHRTGVVTCVGAWLVAAGWVGIPRIYPDTVDGGHPRERLSTVALLLPTGLKTSRVVGVWTLLFSVAAFAAITRASLPGTLPWGLNILQP
jgi:hypothetical protein